MLSAVVLLAVGLWPATAVAGIGWSFVQLRRRRDPSYSPYAPEGVPVYLVVAVALAVAGLAFAGFTFAALLRHL
ncbi:MAG: hypothetical protein AAF907_11380 [Planctomycetota bacterium]